MALAIASITLVVVTIQLEAGGVTKLLLFMLTGMLALAIFPLLDPDTGHRAHLRPRHPRS